MPKPSQHALTWSENQQGYELRTSGQFQRFFRQEDGSAWQAWMQENNAFAFEGRGGHLSVIKEVRPRGGGYWYAYSRQARRTRKRYLGRTAALVHLEQVASDLVGEHGNVTELTAPMPFAGVEPHRSLSYPSSKSQISLPATKLFPPRLPVLLVERERLLKKLDAISSHRLVLLSAAAGSGKTLLLSTWATQKRASAQIVAWLSLDHLDNDPTRFWTAVIAALRTCRAEIGEKALALLHAAQQPALTMVLLALIDDLLTLNAQVVVVLDDYHLVTEQSIHTSLLFLLEHLPPNLHLVLATRADPALPLPQMRVSGQLIEIRDLDLRFRQEETSSFLTRMIGNTLNEEEVNLLQSRTEGWIAGLQLAALALRERENRPAFLQAYTGSYRHLFDYIQQEIIQRQPEPTQRFLLQVAVLPSMNAALCQAVTGEATSQLILEELQRNNLFVVPLDEQQQWFRFHDLFREALLASLHAIQPELVPLLHERAAHWYEQQGLLPEAIDAALQSRNFSRAADLIERFLVPHSFRNAYPLLRRWLEHMPEETLNTYPALSFVYAEALVFTSDRRDPTTRKQFAQALKRAERGFRAQKDDQKLSELLSLRALLAFFQNDLLTSFELARQTRQLQPIGGHHWRGSGLLILGSEKLLAGEMEQARSHILEARVVYEADQSLPGLIATSLLLGEIALGQGEMGLASQFYHQALEESENAAQELLQHQLVNEAGTRETLFTRLALEGLAHLAYERNDLDTAEQLLTQAWELGGSQAEELHFLISGSLLRARILQARGRTIQAQEFLSKRAAQARTPQFLREVRACIARLALAEGEPTKAEDWLKASESLDSACWLIRKEEEALIIARLRTDEEAQRMLAPWKKLAEAQKRWRAVLEIQLLEAQACFAQGQLPEAREILLPLLRRTQGEGYQRLFLDEGQAMQALLKSTLAHIAEKTLATYVRELLRAFHQEQAVQGTLRQETLPEPLSPQEQKVLRLLVDGRSNPEIAEVLIVSVNTVKAHLKNIFRKLDVTNRVQAVEVAHSEQLV